MQTHYNYTYDRESKSYNFITKNGIFYKVSFIVDETFSTLSEREIPNVYQIVLDKISSETEPLDSKVFRTVECIIVKFFEKVENSILYVCSEDEGKEKQRLRVFNRWYNKSKHKESIKKVDKVIVIDDENSPIFTSFMYHINNPNYKDILKIYTSLEDLLREDK